VRKHGGLKEREVGIHNPLSPPILRHRIDVLFYGALYFSIRHYSALARSVISTLSPFVLPDRFGNKSNHRQTDRCNALSRKSPGFPVFSALRVSQKAGNGISGRRSSLVVSCSEHGEGCRHRHRPRQFQVGLIGQEPTILPGSTRVTPSASATSPSVIDQRRQPAAHFRAENLIATRIAPPSSLRSVDDAYIFATGDRHVKGGFL